MRLTALLLVVGAVVAIELSSDVLRSFYVDHPLQAGILTGILLTVVVLFGVDAVRADLNERRWAPLSRLALLSLNNQTTLLIDVALWLVTAQQPSNDARPDPGEQRTLEAFRTRLGLAPPPDQSDLGAVGYDQYRGELGQLARDSEWNRFANAQLDRWKWRNRDGISRWAAAMLTTGEAADVLNRLAMLNERLSDVQHALRSDQSEPDHVVASWIGWLAEAVSLREDLVRAARGELPDEWRRFRVALPEPARAELEDRTLRWPGPEGARRVLSQPLKAGHTH